MNPVAPQMGTPAPARRRPLPFSTRTLALWMVAHAATALAAGLLVRAPYARGIGLFGWLALLGVMQPLVLRRRVRGPWLWPLLTAVGVGLACVPGAGWLVTFTLGLGLGLAQKPLLLGRGFRFPLLVYCEEMGQLWGACGSPFDCAQGRAESRPPSPTRAWAVSWRASRP